MRFKQEPVGVQGRIWVSHSNVMGNEVTSDHDNVLFTMLLVEDVEHGLDQRLRAITAVATHWSFNTRLSSSVKSTVTLCVCQGTLEGVILEIQMQVGKQAYLELSSLQ